MNLLDFGFWILDFGFWILDFGFWILDFGFWILDFGFEDFYTGLGNSKRLTYNARGVEPK